MTERETICYVCGYQELCRGKVPICADCSRWYQPEDVDTETETTPQEAVDFVALEGVVGADLNAKWVETDWAWDEDSKAWLFVGDVQ